MKPSEPWIYLGPDKATAPRIVNGIYERARRKRQKKRQEGQSKHAGRLGRAGRGRGYNLRSDLVDPYDVSELSTLRRWAARGDD